MLWIIVAFLVGVMVGFFVGALMAAAEEREGYYGERQ